MCAAVKYLPGDIVWVKVPRYPWWPAEVVAQQDCKIPNNGKKEPVAFITFPCEDAYDIIRSESNIMPFEAENKKNYIKKGENLPNDLKERFLLALRTSQKTLRKNQGKSNTSSGDDAFTNLLNNPESPFSSRHFPSSEPSFLRETPTSPSNATTTTASTTGNHTKEISEPLQYSCGQCDFTTSRLNLMIIHYKPEENILRCPNLPESIVLNADSRKRRIAENDAYLRSQQQKVSRKAPPAESPGRVPCYARIPSSPPSQKTVPPARDKGSCYMFTDEPVKQPTHKPSFSYRSLQQNKVGPRKLDLTSTPKRTISSPETPSPSPKSHTKIKPSKEQRNGVLSPKKSDKRREEKEFQRREKQVQRREAPKVLQEQPQQHKQIQPQQQKQPQQPALLPETVLFTPDTVLPEVHKPEETIEKSAAPPPQLENTEPKENEKENEESLKMAVNVLEPEKQETNQKSQENSDPNTQNKIVDSDDSSCSTDDEVADGLSAMKSDLPVVENDTVWVKLNKYPFWPALITKVFTKQHHIYRLSVRFFGEILAKETLDFGINYSKDTVIAFNDPLKEEFIKQGLSSEWMEKFDDAMHKVNDYINKKGGRLSPISDEQYLCKSNSSSPDPSESSEKNESDNTNNESSWYPVENVNIVEETHTVAMVPSDLVEQTVDVCQTVLELENPESSKDFTAPTVSVMPEIWIPSVDETSLPLVGSEVVLHDIDQDVLVPRDSA